MKRAMWAGAALAALAACAGAAAPEGSCEDAPGPGVFELYVLGDSTAAGYYAGTPPFPALVKEAFGGRIAGRPIELRSLARGRSTIFSQLEELERALACRRSSNSGALLVYAGHNDRAPEGSSSLLDRLEAAFERWPAVTKALRSASVRERLGRRHTDLGYRRHMRRTVRSAREAGLVPFVAVPVMNLSDMDPKLPRGTPLTRGAPLSEIERGLGLERRGRWAEAQAVYAALRPWGPWRRGTDQTRAYLEYRSAVCARAMGRREEALRRFWAAADLSSLDNFDRVATWQLEFLRGLAAEGAFVVDPWPDFERASPDGFVGDSLFVDGHHPNDAGTLLLADAFARELSRVLGEPVRRKLASRPPAAARGDRVRAEISAGRWYLSSSVGHALPESRLAKARARFRAASELAPGTFSPLLGTALVEAALRGGLYRTRRSADWTTRFFPAYGGNFDVPRKERPLLIERLREFGVSEDSLRRLAAASDDR